MRTAAALLLGAAGTLACAAPASRPATGEIAGEVRASIASGRASFDNAGWDRLLKGGTRDGLVDYAWFQGHRADLDAWLATVGSARIAELSGGHLEAMLVNAYNALTIRSILDHPGVRSIRDIDGVWTKITHRVGGHDLTLDQIEHNLLRPFFKDPRIHFVVNCASRSCAPLAGSAYEGDRIQEQLEEAARRFLSDRKNARVEGGKLALSKYFEWYGGDFTAADWSPRASTIPGFVALYAGPDVAAFVKESEGSPPVEFLDYDWSLNGVGSP